MFSVDFNKRIVGNGFVLPYHRAEKSISFVNEEGLLVQPKEKNGIKFETFVFDAVLFSKKVFLLEVERAEEFAPVKNKDGEDSPVTAKNMYMERCRQMLLKSTDDPNVIEKIKNAKNVEINPSIAYQKEKLSKLLAGLKKGDSDICF